MAWITGANIYSHLTTLDKKTSDELILAVQICPKIVIAKTLKKVD